MKNINISAEHGFNAINKFIGSNDFFIDAYQNALNELEIITNSFEENEKTKIYIETSNNIITFTGDRGQGKTSAMYVFIDILKNINEHNKNNNNSKNSALFISENISKLRFHRLNPIDPSSFEKTHNIVLVVIAQMFQKFNEKFNENNSRSTLTNNLLQAFNSTFEALTVKQYDMNDLSLNYENNIYKLSRLGDSTNLKNKLQTLVKLYLEYMGNSSVLLVPIDDLDLSSNNAYNITEDIRRYLIIPKVIIIMAVKFDQLQQCIANAQTGFPNINIQDVAVKYLNKLIPIKRRIALPSPRSDDANITVEDKKYESIIEAIFEILVQKTGIELNKYKKKNNPFVPATLRELVSVMLFLYNLPKDNLTESLIQFQKFLVYSWALDKITYEQIAIITSLFNTNDSDKNNYICGKLLEIISHNLSNTIDKNSISHSYIITINKEYLNKIYGKKCSYGDVLSLTTILADINEDNTTKNFVFIIKALYTSRLHELLEQNQKEHMLEIFGNNLLGSRINYETSLILPTSSMIIRDSWGYFKYNIKNNTELFNAALASENIIAGNNTVYNESVFDIGIFFLSIINTDKNTNNNILIHKKLNNQAKYQSILDSFYEKDIYDITIKLFSNMEKVSEIIDQLIFEAPNMRGDNDKNLFNVFFEKFSTIAFNDKDKYNFKNRNSILNTWKNLHDNKTQYVNKIQYANEINKMQQISSRIGIKRFRIKCTEFKNRINTARISEIITYNRADYFQNSIQELIDNTEEYFNGSKIKNEGMEMFNTLTSQFNMDIQK